MTEHLYPSGTLEIFEALGIYWGNIPYGILVDLVLLSLKPRVTFRGKWIARRVIHQSLVEDDSVFVRDEVSFSKLQSNCLRGTFLCAAAGPTGRS